MSLIGPDAVPDAFIYCASFPNQPAACRTKQRTCHGLQFPCSINGQEAALYKLNGEGERPHPSKNLIDKSSVDRGKMKIGNLLSACCKACL